MSDLQHTFYALSRNNALDTAKRSASVEADKALGQIYEIVKGPLPWHSREVNPNRAKIMEIINHALAAKMKEKAK